MKLIKAFILFLIFISTFGVYKVYQSSWYMTILLDDFNVSKYFDRPLSQIEIIPDNFPNISLTTIPIKAAKSNYYIKQGKLEEAKKLLFESYDENPYLGMNDSNLSEVYYEEKVYDSALYYARIAVNKLPNNPRHIVNLQKSFYGLGNWKGLDSLYNIYKNDKYITYHFFQNHFMFLISSKKNDFTDYHKHEVLETTKRFPDNKILKVYEKSIVYEAENISLSNELDKNAFEMYDQKNYELAIKNWENAIEILPSEDSYYLNIAQSYLMLDELNSASYYLKLVETSNEIDESIDGKLEFLKGTVEYKKNNFKAACEFFTTSFNKGYKLSKSMLIGLKCD